MTLLLDTTVLIDYLRGRTATLHAVQERVLQGVPLLTTGINVEEVVRGLRPEEQRKAEALFDGLPIVPIGRSEGWQAGQWRAEFASHGVTLTQADCLIAATARSAGAKLATGNPRHFPMAGVAVEHWPVG